MSGRLYFIQEEPNGAIKIGWTKKSVDTRWSHLQMGNPRPIRLLAILEPAEKSMEALWHKRFRSVRVRGEWFWPSIELREAIKAETTPVKERWRWKRAVVSAPEAWVRSLQGWMEQNGIDAVKLAALTGYVESYARDVSLGRCALSVPAAKRLELISGGELKASELLRSTIQTCGVRSYYKRLADGREA